MEFFEYGKWKIGILFEDNHLIFAQKPANLPVQADSSGDMDMLSILKEYIRIKYAKPGNVYLGLVHRLDRPVGGVMVFAKTSKAAARLSAQFSAHTNSKMYLAVLQGEMHAETRMEDYLFADEKSGMVRRAKSTDMGAKRAELISSPVAVRDGLTLTRVTLLTGRKHQIRVQHASSGFPLWGDARYGGGKSGQQIALWAESLTVEHPTLKTPVTVRSTPPASGAWLKFSDLLREE